jgi:hypothetical protein
MKLRWREDAVLLFLTIFLALPFQAPAEGMERSTSLKVEGAYYFDNNEGYGVSDGGFAPISYSPVEPLGIPWPFRSLVLSPRYPPGSNWKPRSRPLLSSTSTPGLCSAPAGTSGCSTAWG